MGGGLMQLVAYGAQDVYLTGNPQITFFKVVYRRHTNFSREVIEQTFSGTADKGKQISVTISRNGDLVHKLYVETKPVASATAGTVAANIGHAMFNEIELEIGGQTIDRIWGHWMEVWARLTVPNETGVVAPLNGSGQPTRALIAGGPNEFTFPSGTNVGSSGVSGSGSSYFPITRYQQMAGGAGVCTGDWLNVSSTMATQPIPPLSVPLPFWFCRNAGNSLPLIALQYHEVKLKIQFSSMMIKNMDPQVWAEYIYLDTSERRRFAQGSHEYLIEQLQRVEQNLKVGSTAETMDLNFNHPVKELVFSAGFTTSNASKQGMGFLPGWANASTQVTLKLNGHDRFNAQRRFDYFSRTQIYEHHTGPGNLYLGAEGHLHDEVSGSDTSLGSKDAKYDQIGVYSFALKPEEHQPSGTCNFSRIDSTRLTFSGIQGKDTVPITVYAVNYNVLRIMSGMGGLAYSN
tara:strand:+ start:2650 stop:4029 length:1380 start_codon:yes stop_codon:yes gene_type:complete